MWLGRRGTCFETPSNPDLTPTATTVRETGSAKRDHDAMVAQPTASNGWRLGLGHSRRDRQQATQRRNGSGSYSRKRPRQGTVTRGDDVSTTSVRPTHSVALSSTRSEDRYDKRKFRSFNYRTYKTVLNLLEAIRLRLKETWSIESYSSQVCTGVDSRGSDGTGCFMF